MPPKRTFWGSFLAAGRGILTAAASGRNFRIQICAAIYIVWISILGDVKGAELAVVLLTCALVMFAEVSNTAIELLCDLYTTEANMMIRAIKDVAAGAVLICSVFSCFVGAAIFLDRAVLDSIIRSVTENPVMDAVMLLTVPFAVLFIRKNKKSASR